MTTIAFSLVVASLACAACSEPTTEVSLRGRDTLRAPVRLDFEILSVESGQRDLVSRFVDELDDESVYQILLGERSGEQRLLVQAFDREERRVGLGQVQLGVSGERVSLIVEPDAFSVNTTIVGSQQLSWDWSYVGRQLAVAPDGRFMVAWEHQRGPEQDVRARLFEANTVPRPNGVSFTASEYVLPNYPDRSSHVALAYGDGAYLATWEDEQDGQDPKQRIVGRLYHAEDGQSVRNFPESALSPAGVSAGSPVPFSHSGIFGVAWLAGGEFSGDSGTLFVRALDTSGEPTGSPETVSSSGGLQEFPDAVGLRDGGFALAWQQDEDGVGESAWVRVFDASAQALGPEHRIGTTAELEATMAPKLAALADGGFVAVWIYESSNGRKVMMQEFDASGATRGDSVEVARVQVSSYAAVASNTSGIHALVWHTGNSNGEEYDLWVRYYSSGAALGPAVMVNTQVAGSQATPSIQALPAGGFLVAWSDNSATGADVDREGVSARAVYPPVLP